MALDEVAVLVPVELDALCKLTHELCEPDVQEIWPLPRIPQGGVPDILTENTPLYPPLVINQAPVINQAISNCSITCTVVRVKILF